MKKSKTKNCTHSKCKELHYARGYCKSHYRKMLARGKLKGNPSGPVDERFWSKVDVRDNGECWPWSGYRNKEGYGTFYFDNTMRKAHRVSYILKHGSIPDGKLIMHTCDNPSCVNPAHLRPGTNKENAQDRASKGRGFDNRGEHSHRTKLKDRHIPTIRRLLKDTGLKQKEIGKLYGISANAVGFINQGSSWKHV